MIIWRALSSTVGIGETAIKPLIDVRLRDLFHLRCEACSKVVSVNCSWGGCVMSKQWFWLPLFSLRSCVNLSGGTGYSASDMKNLVKEASMGPLREALMQGREIGNISKDEMRPISVQVSSFLQYPSDLLLRCHHLQQEFFFSFSLKMPSSS
jgi:hypothetical protein